MITAIAVFKGLEKTQKGIEKAQIAQVRNLNSSFRVEGFRMKNLLQKQIREGAPGARKFDDLSIIGRRWWYQRRKNNPIYKLATGVRYHIPNTASPVVQIGFVGPINKREHDTMVRSGLKLSSKGGYRGIMTGDMTSKSWRRLAKIHQEGFDRPVTPKMRASLGKRGAALASKQIGRKRKKWNVTYRPFFLKQTTISFHTPARPIIDPFWKQQKNISIRNIRENYNKKMKDVYI